MVGELVLKMLRRKVASSEGDEMVSVFNVVEQHVAFRNICDDVWIQEQSAKRFVAALGFSRVKRRYRKKDKMNPLCVKIQSNF